VGLWVVVNIRRPDGDGQPGATVPPRNFSHRSWHLPTTCPRRKDIESPVNPETLKEEQK
jgi:hypothetical protein